MRRRWLAAAAVTAALPVAVLGGVAANAFASSHASNATNRTINMITLYGWPDNSPPGNATEFGTGHAGGNGTFANPTTFATDQNEFAPGTLIYYPALQRYFVMQDECVACDSDFANGVSHIDLWVGGTASDSSSAVQNCEAQLTASNASIIVNPPSNEPVHAGVIYNSSTGSCNGGATTGGGSGASSGSGAGGGSGSGGGGASGSGAATGGGATGSGSASGGSGSGS